MQIILDDLIFLINNFPQGRRKRRQAIMFSDVRLRVRRLSAIRFFLTIAVLFLFYPLYIWKNPIPGKEFWYTFSVFFILNTATYYYAIVHLRKLERATITYTIVALFNGISMVEIIYLFLRFSIIEGVWLWVGASMVFPLLLVPYAVKRKADECTDLAEKGFFSKSFDRENGLWNSLEDNTPKDIPRSLDGNRFVISVLITIVFFGVFISYSQSQQFLLFIAVGLWWLFVLGMWSAQIGLVQWLKESEEKIERPILLEQYVEV